MIYISTSPEKDVLRLQELLDDVMSCAAEYEHCILTDHPIAAKHWWEHIELDFICVLAIMDEMIL